MIFKRLKRFGIDLNTLTHSAGKINALDVLTFGDSGLEVLDRLDERSSVLCDLVSREAHFTDGGVYNTELVNLEVDLTALHLFDSFRYVHGNGTALGVRHESARTEHATESTDLTHDLRLGDDDINVCPSTFDLFDILIQTYVVSTCLFGSCLLVRSTECENANHFTGTVRESYDAANHLVSLAGVNTQAYVDIYGGIELGGGDLFNESSRLLDGVELACFNLASSMV